MEKRTSAAARIFAAFALVAAAVVIIAVVAGAIGGSDSKDGSRQGTKHQAHKQRPKTKAATYVVKSGDTLVSIAHRTGIPVAHIIALNPEVDPQILIAGETLKLR